MVWSVNSRVVTVATGNRVITWMEVVHLDVSVVGRVKLVKNHVVTVATWIHVMT